MLLHALVFLCFSTLSGLISECSGQSQFPEPYTFVTLAGRYETGNPGYPVGGYEDAVGTNALFSFPSGVAVDKAGNLYVADSFNCVIRRVAPEVCAGVTNWVVTTLAGRVQIGAEGYPVGGYADGIGTNALFGWPSGIALDNAGKIYVTEEDNYVVRMITPTPAPDLSTTNWVVTTIAGQAGTTGHQDGTNNGATFSLPTGIAVDRSGELLVCDNNPGIIRRISPQGTNWVVTTFAGGGSAPFDPENSLGDGLGTNAQFQFVFGLAEDHDGNIFVADAGNNAIRKLSPVGDEWLVTTLAGAGVGIAEYLDGPRGAGWFEWPTGVAVDESGNVFVTDSGNAAIRKITPDGIVTTLAGSRTANGPYPGYTPIPGWRDGTGTNAMFRSPYGITLSSGGLLYVVEQNNTDVRMGWPYEAPPCSETHEHPEIILQPQSQAVAATYQAMFTVAITNATPVSYQWQKDGHEIPGATNAMLILTNVSYGDAGQYKTVIAFIRGNNPHPYLHPLESASAILTVTVPYTFTSLAGWLEPGLSNGVGAHARFHSPMGMAINSDGDAYVADFDNSIIRQITRGGDVTTLAPWEVAGPGVPVGGRPAQFTQPTGLTGDRAGNLYLASFDSSIKKLTWMGTNWLVSTIAGAPGIGGSADGLGPNARFSYPIGIASDSRTNLYVVDSLNFTIRKLTPAGTNWYVTTLAGTPGVPGLNDGTNGDAQFTFARGIAADGAGNVFVADTGNHAIRQITPAGVVTTIAGSRPNIGSADGLGSVAQFLFPSWVATDRTGALYVADHYNSGIRKLVQVGTNWLVTTIAGRSGHEGQQDGTGSQVQFVFPNSIAVDGLGNLYVADQFDVIRKGWAASAQPVIVLNPPIMSDDHVQVDFALATGVADSFTLLESAFPKGPWSIAHAVLGTNVPGVSFSLTAPLMGGPSRYYRVQVR